MVLDDSWNENAPPSDNDAYSNPENAAQSIQLSTAGLPKPVPIFGSLFGYNEQYFNKIFQLRATQAASVLNRPLSQDEINSFAYWSAKQNSIMSYGSPIGIAGGLWRCWSTAGTNRLPFINVKMDFSKVPPKWLPKDMIPPASGPPPPLRGNLALAWHAVRALAYGGFGKILGDLFFGSYTASVIAVGQINDARLKPYVDAMRKKAAEQKGSLSGASGQQQRAPAPVNTQKSSPNYDDASPTGGMFGEMESSSPQAEPQWQPPPQSKPAPAPAQTPTPNPAPYRTAPEQQGQPFDMFDDASPTAAQQGMVADTQSRQPQGSAWERLRRGGRPTPTEEPTGGRGWDNVRKSQDSNDGAWKTQQQQTQRDTASYSISRSDEQKGYAKEEAQKEFDDRIERERKGGDFSAGGSPKRW
ncbi:hypothetical protein LSUE1_G002408 [Lachnellula suecica]|uniref:Uncharacterized protein n=1 Tax=Lachnellula suecica TaxID=602035 RepID=A0A8T9C9E7_9HELO|nr:hypothetical protein LSUE1_G002408 [Lachnellula suecica]